MRILISIIVLSTLIFSGVYATDDLDTTLLIPKKSYSVTLSTLKNPITLVYNGDSSKLTDTITVIQKGRKNRVLPGPMSQYSKPKREEILACVSLGKSNCIENFALGTIDPKGRFFEIHMQGFQKEGWSLRSIATGKVLLSNDTGILDSSWSSDGSSFSWITGLCLFQKCTAKSGVYYAKTSDFTQAIKIAEINEYSLGYRVKIESDAIRVVEIKSKFQKITTSYDKVTGLAMYGKI